MFTKTTLPKTDNQNAEIVSQQQTGSNTRILPAVSPIQQKSVESKAEPIQRNIIEEEPLQGKFEIAQQNSQTAQLESNNAAPTKNNTGIPNQLKSGIENLSGIGMDDVKVHYNSDKPAQLNALAYAQGTNIHVASGQEKHLPHEAWHVVQQKQGRVKPTIQMKEGVPVNDDAGLEKEADVMGAQATARGNMVSAVQKKEVKQLKNVIPIATQLFDAPLSKKRRSLTDENDYDSQEMEEKKENNGGEKELKDQFQDLHENKNENPNRSFLSRILSGITGGVNSAKNSIVKGASSAKEAIISKIPLAKQKIVEMFTTGKRSDIASNVLSTSTVIPSAGSGATGLVNKAMGYKEGPNVNNGFKGGAEGSGSAIGGFGAAGDLLGVGAHLAKAFSHGEDATDASHTTSKKIEAGAASLSSVSEGTKSAASAAHQIASLVNSHGVAAAGSAIAMAGASVATGAIDILRGGYGIWSAEQRKSILNAIAEGAEKQGEEGEELIEIGNQEEKQKKVELAQISLMAKSALAKQENVRDDGIGNVVKGSLAVGAGIAVLLGAATPVGWVLLGAGAAVAGIMLLVNYVKSKKAKKEVVAKILKVDDKKKKYDEDVEKVKKETWPFTDKRKQLMEPYEPEEEKDPLEVAIKEKNEGDLDALYDKRIDDTAKVLYTEGVCKHSEDANNQYTQILNGLGLKPNLAQGQDPQPSIEKIKKALSL